MVDRQTLDWLNCAKFMAVFAVMINHTDGVCYTNQHIAYASYYSVSLFIFISGFLNYYSNKRHSSSYLVSLGHSLKKISLAYVVATFVYQVYGSHSFDLITYLNALVHFNMSGPFYYVLLYIQLMLVNKPIYEIVSAKVKNKPVTIMKDIMVGCAVLFVAFWTTNYTNILGVYGGGGKLLGGNFLLQFYVGMLVAKYGLFNKITLRKSVVFTVIGGCLYFGWWQFACKDMLALDAKIPFGGGINPPSITITLLAAFMWLLCYGIFNFFDKIPYLTFITSGIGWVGKYTLYIFLYHKFFLDYFLTSKVIVNNTWIRFIVYFSIMIFGSIAINYLFKAIVICYKKIVELPKQ